MGYSCSAKASEVLACITEYCVKSTGSSNTWVNENGVKFFFETGREQDDGAITGSVHKFIDDRMCVRAGTFKIDASGKIVRFAGLSKNVKNIAHYDGMKSYHEKYEQKAMFQII